MTKISTDSSKNKVLSLPWWICPSVVVDLLLVASSLPVGIVLHWGLSIVSAAGTFGTQWWLIQSALGHSCHRVCVMTVGEIFSELLLPRTRNSSASAFFLEINLNLYEIFSRLRGQGLCPQDTFPFSQCRNFMSEELISLLVTAAH